MSIAWQFHAIVALKSNDSLKKLVWEVDDAKEVSFMVKVPVELWKKLMLLSSMSSVAEHSKVCNDSFVIVLLSGETRVTMGS